MHAIPVATNVGYKCSSKKAECKRAEPFHLNALIEVAIDLPANAFRSSGKRAHVEKFVIEGFGSEPSKSGPMSPSGTLDATGTPVGLLEGGCVLLVPAPKS